MKNLYFISKYFFIALIMLGGFSLKSYSQCDDITVSLKITDNPCGQNGSIEVTVTGNDVSGETPKYTGLQYRAFLTGSDPDDAQWHDQNIIGTLSAGTYTVEIRGKCKDSPGGNYEPKTVTRSAVIKQLGGVDQGEYDRKNRSQDVSLQKHGSGIFLGNDRGYATL
ncbi:MAG: hypothetical protein ACLVKO_01120 [Dysgonomonas sp.]